MPMKIAEEIIKDYPYTVVGINGTPKPTHSITLTAEGIKHLANIMNIGDRVQIKNWQDVTDECEKIRSYQRITIFRNQ